MESNCPLPRAPFLSNQGAIRAYCAGRLWDKARALAGNNPTFTRYIEDQYNNYLLQNQQADELAMRVGQHAQQVRGSWWIWTVASAVSGGYLGKLRKLTLRTKGKLGKD